MWHVTGRFHVIGETGTDFTIVEMTDGEKHDIILEDGRAVVTQGDGSFVIYETGEVLSRRNCSGNQSGER